MRAVVSTTPRAIIARGFFYRGINVERGLSEFNTHRGSHLLDSGSLGRPSPWRLMTSSLLCV